MSMVQGKQYVLHQRDELAKRNLFLNRILQASARDILHLYEEVVLTGAVLPHSCGTDFYDVRMLREVQELRLKNWSIARRRVDRDHFQRRLMRHHRIFAQVDVAKVAAS